MIRLPASVGRIAAQQFAGATSQVVVIDARSGAMTPVPQSAGGRPTAINVHGTIVGSVPAGMVGRTAMLWRHGNAEALPGTSGPSGAVPQLASGLSRNGRFIAGASNGTSQVATIWTCG